MKLKNVIPKRNHPEFIWRFGGAKLVKLQSGQHELIGGSEQDKADALDWISLFAPEIVFHHFQRQWPARCGGVDGPDFADTVADADGSANHVKKLFNSHLIPKLR